MLDLTVSKKTGKLTDDSKSMVDKAMRTRMALQITCPEEAKAVTEYTLEKYKVSSKDYVLEFTLDTMLHIWDKDNGSKVIGISFGNVLGMRTMTFILKGDSDPDYYATEYIDLVNKTAFCYVLNLDEPDYSEFGDCKFEFFTRIG